MHLRPTQLVINLGALRHNLTVVRAATGGRPLCAVVKANAYGHGMAETAAVLADSGVEAFGVALVEEGLALRAAGIQTPILVWAADFAGPRGAAPASVWRTLLAAGLTPVLQSAAQVASLAGAAAAAATERVGIHVEVDVGMARGGLAAAQLPALADALARHPQVRLDGLMGHLSGADSPHLEAFTHAQAERLEAAAATLASLGTPPAVLHLANSAGALAPLAPDLGRRFDMARVGLALWGLQPAPAAPAHGLRPVLRWTTRLVAVREVARGEPVSYGCLWRAPGPTRVGTLAVGYADGYTRRLTGRAQVLVRGTRLPVVGAICMDFCMVDLAGAPEANVGDEVVLVGEADGDHISVDDLAGWSGTISWEVLCGLGPRLARLFVEERPR